jgi:hypothetical protein
MGMALKAQSNIAHLNTGRTDCAFVVFCKDEETRDLTRYSLGEAKREGW